MPYHPKPIDTAGIELSQDLLDLTELLAESTHDHWALQRLAEKWTYGPVRDDQAKTHPDLVPYGELPESEKEYDRRTAMETLKAIIALGYRIEKDNGMPK
ncbi:MAG: RyR domain-containing protein [Armatimonadota bacterium]